MEGRLTDALAQFELAQARARQAGKGHEARFDPLILDGLASVAERRGEWWLAVQRLRSLAASRADDAPTRQRLGVALFHARDREGALVLMREAVRLDPSLPPPELTLAQLSEGAGERDAADRDLGAAVSRFPKDQRVRTAQASLLLKRDRAQEALEVATQAMALGPNRREAGFVAGLAARRLKDSARAATQFQMLYDENPDDLESLAQLALALADSDAPESRSKALQYAMSLVRQSPQNRNAYATLGFCHYRLGQLAEARHALTTAISGGQGPAVAGYYLACVLRDLKEPDAIPALLEAAAKAEDPFIYREEVSRWRQALAETKSSVESSTALAK